MFKNRPNYADGSGRIKAPVTLQVFWGLDVFSCCFVYTWSCQTNFVPNVNQCVSTGTSSNNKQLLITEHPGVVLGYTSSIIT